MFVYGLSDDIEKLKINRELTGIGLMVDNTKSDSSRNQMEADVSHNIS